MFFSQKKKSFGSFRSVITSFGSMKNVFELLSELKMFFHRKETFSDLKNFRHFSSKKKPKMFFLVKKKAFKKSENINNSWY